MPKVTIANGVTESGEANVRRLAGVFIPASFTGTSITFLTVLSDGTTWVPVDSNGSVYSRTVRANTYCPVDPTVFAGLKKLKVKSGSAETGPKVLELVSS